MRENIRLMTQNGLSRVDVALLNEAVPPNGAVFKNFFTLAGTVREYPGIESLASFGCLPEHYGYSSIGIIEEVGRDWSIAEKGSIILIPAHYSTYVVLHTSAPTDWQNLMCKILPESVDKVEALFFPLLCVALQIKDQFQDPDAGAIVFWGCGLLGIILLKLFALEDIHPVVFLDEPDVKAELLWQNGAESVIKNIKDIPQKTGQVVVLASEYPDLAHDGMSSNINYVDVRIALTGKRPRYAWQSHDIWQNAVELVCSQQVTFKDLIAQHVHAEAVFEVERSIQNGLYQGKTIVYDW